MSYKDTKETGFRRSTRLKNLKTENVIYQTCPNREKAEEEEKKAISDVSLTEVSYLEFAVLVDKQIAWFEIAMKDVSRVDVLEPSQQLKQEILEMFFAEFLRRVNDPVQVALHQIENDVDIVHRTRRFRRADNLKDRYNVVVLEMLQNLYLAVCSFCDRYLLKYVWDFLDGDFLVCFLVNGGAHHAVRAAADFFDRFIVCVF